MDYTPQEWACRTRYLLIQFQRWARGVAVNMSPCHGEDRRFESDRARSSFFHFTVIVEPSLN